MSPDPWKIVKAVAELPDRTSPEDRPDMMLVTGDELAAIILAHTALSHPVPDVPGAEDADYDAGLLNDWGGGNVDWWQDYLRAEIGRANDHWRAQMDSAREELLESARRVEEMQAENADLKTSVIAFAGPAAVRYAADWGLPEGHLASHHYDILEKCGARMTDFTRAALKGT
jgi:hypothetical protein